MIRLRHHNCDSKLRFAFDSTAIRLRSDYDVSRAPDPFDVIRREQKMNMSFFRRSLVIVVSQSSRTQIVISITSVVVECVVVSSYRSRVVDESQLWCRLYQHSLDVITSFSRFRRGRLTLKFCIFSVWVSTNTSISNHRPRLGSAILVIFGVIGKLPSDIIIIIILW